MMKTKLILALVVFTLLSEVNAQPGTLDTSFNTLDAGLANQGANFSVNSTFILPDGKIIIAGGLTTYNGVPRSGIARLNSDGTLDETFNSGTGTQDVGVFSMVIQEDGKIIIGGNFYLYNGIVRNNIARINTDGSLDNTFNPGTGANATVVSLSIQNDGKILVGGGFTYFNGVLVNYLTRLNTDGSIDTSFSGNPITFGIPQTISTQPDGKIIVGGSFLTNQNLDTKILRLNADGSFDQTFILGTNLNALVSTLNIQNDGKIIAGGNFTSYNGISRSYIARLNIDGSLDQTFNPELGFNNSVYKTTVLENGQILVGGNYSSFNGVTRNRIALLNSNGTLDQTFEIGTGANNFVSNFSIQSDGKIIIGGGFTSYNGTPKTRIARINGAILDTPSFENNPILVYPNPTSSTLNINTTKNIDSISIYNLLGQLVLESKEKETINVQGLEPGQYIIKLTSGSTSQIKKFVKN